MVSSMRPAWPTLARVCRGQGSVRHQTRSVSIGTLRYRTPPRPLPPPGKYRTAEAMDIYKKTYLQPYIPPAPKHFKIYQPPGKSGKTLCPEPLNAWRDTQLQVLDPTGARTRLFSEQNDDGARVGDVLMVRFRNGDPFSGVCLNIRRRGVDTGILLRNQLSRVGTEMWVKIYAPTVTGIEIVERRAKRARRARLYYLRKPKHDRGSLEGVVEQYMKKKLATGRGATKVKRKGATTSSAAQSTPAKGA